MNLGNILITGGAGYIGSHIVKTFKKAHPGPLIVLDNLSTGFRHAIPTDVKFVHGDIQDKDLLASLFRDEKICAVIHLAAASVIPESVTNPIKYYQNNACGTLNLLQICVEHQIKHFIFSSTAAVYGDEQACVQESSLTKPKNPYGFSKLMCEQFLKDIAQSHDLRFVNLRYFNVAGADPEGEIGQCTHNATHLIKVAVQTACGLHESMPIYGTDYSTPDGTCIRDFIHVSDIADIHLKALLYLQNDGASVTLNCGYGHGFSVKEVIKTVEKVSAQPFPAITAPRRSGDLPTLIADNTQVKKVLNWQPKFDDLTFIVKTALDWEKQLIAKHKV